MSLTIPTTAELNAAIIAQFESKFGGTVPVWAKAFLRVTAMVLAGIMIILYKFGGSMFLQMFVQFASDQEFEINGKKLIPLVEWGRLTGTGDPTEATRAELVIDISVNSQVGSLPQGTQYFNATNEVTYLTVADVLLDAATVQASIRPQSDQSGGGGKGVIGNLEVGDVVSLVTPLGAVVTDATVSAVTTTAANAESTEIYRQRIIDRFRNQPQGGAPADYELWGEAVEGIINTYPYTGDPGVVNLYSEATVASSGSDDGIPTAAQLQAVLDNVNLDDSGLASRRPIDSLVYSYPITRSAYDVTVGGLTGSDDPDDTESKIEAALTQYFLSREPWISGLTVSYRRDRVTKAEVMGAVQDTAGAYNAVFTSLTVEKVGVGEIVVDSLGEGEKAKLGTVSFVN